MKKIVKISILLLLLIAFLYYQNNVIVITEIQYSNNKIPKSFDGLKIVHLSDLHNKTFGEDQRKLTKKIKDNQPDLIFITGDFIDSKKTDVDAAMTLIIGLKSVAPIYYVPGNHEARSSEYNDLKTQLLKENVIVLEDQNILLKNHDGSINIIGLLDPDFHKNPIYETIKNLKAPSDVFTIMLSHRPERFQDYKENEIDLVFSGHAHGGQFRLPIIGGLLSPNQGWFPDLSEGLYKSDQTTMVVSRGLGNSLFPQRLFNQPEIIVLTLYEDK